MAYELRQEVRLSQQLVLTQQLQQAIKLLQLSRLELVESVNEEIETNPVLECGLEGGDTQRTSEPEPEPAREQEAREEDWQSYLEESASYTSGGINFNDNPEDDYLDNIKGAELGLHDHLLGQLHLAGLGEIDTSIGEFLIGNIDGRGYIRSDDWSPAQGREAEEAILLDMSNCIGAATEDVERIIGVIQGFDPTGVAARSTRECLLLQARNLEERDPVVEQVIEDHLGALANKNYKQISQALGIEFDEVIEAAKTIIRDLNPSPCAMFGSGESSTVIPDVFIKKVGDDYVVASNDNGLPRLKISPYYRQLLKNGKDMPSQTKSYIQERFRSALWLIKSVHQRQRTIYRAVESIVKFQREFLDSGVQYLKPLTLKDVAEDIGVHESTVSRVTSNKYADTPRGVFRLKYFFSNAMSNSDGESVAVEHIKNMIRDLIEAENSKKPLSDMKIVEELKKEGIVLSRRTATKYREAMGVLSSHKRKSFL